MNKRLTGAVLAALCLAMAALLTRKPLFMINGSASTPRGLYLVSREPIRVGDYIAIHTGRLAFSNGFNATLLKRAAYAAGETLLIDDDGLTVNGEVFPKARRMGRTGAFTLQAGECLILGNRTNSFDSRYFGPVRIADCTRLLPLVLIDAP
jgi:type IV secretory pathway protease TraF